jgi:hypothetical protein
MNKSLLAMAATASVIGMCGSAPLAMAEHTVNLDVSYLGGFDSEAKIEGDTYDTDLRMQGIKGAFYVPMGEYAFWRGSYDYSTDDEAGNKLEVTVGKVYAGGRLPLGEQFSLKAYVGYASNEIKEEGDGGKDTGAMYGIAADAHLLQALTLEAHVEQAKLDDVTFLETGINGYWHFTPTIAAGLGYKYRDYEVDEAGVSFNLDFSYLEAGLRISF